MTRTEFFQANGFDNIIALSFKQVSVGNFWFPVFQLKEDAVRFSRYVAGFALRVVPKAGAQATAIYLAQHGGYVATLAVEFPGWNGMYEDGLVLCTANEVAGLVVTNDDGGKVLLPLKKFTHTMVTESGSLYVLYSDGTAFCRSKKDGAVKVAGAIYFAPSEEEADRVFKMGGKVNVVFLPAVGHCPLYLSGHAPIIGGAATLAPKSFRCGMPITKIWTA